MYFKGSNFMTVKGNYLMQTSILFSNEIHWHVALGTRGDKLGKGQEYLV